MLQKDAWVYCAELSCKAKQSKLLAVVLNILTVS